MLCVKPLSPSQQQDTDESGFPTGGRNKDVIYYTLCPAYAKSEKKHFKPLWKLMKESQNALTATVHDSNAQQRC